MRRNYETALKLLEARKRPARPKDTVFATPQEATSPVSNQALRGVPSLVGMKEWLQLIGHSDRDIDNLNIIHITGTKGKGSTCAFTRSFLLAHGLRTGFPSKIGLYTSPHLQFIRERIQINEKPISEELFTKYFFEVWDSLASNGQRDTVENPRQPRYLQLLALLAFHTFVREKVQTAIFETHHGGEYDATNVIERPVAAGITSLGMDHITQLGPTVENIAWHKAGIFKPGALAFSVPQEPVPSEVMRNRAAEKGSVLEFVPVNDSLPVNDKVLSVPVQRLNCSLATRLARAFLQVKAPGQELSTDDIINGVKNFSWAGRFQIIVDGHSQWFLDGAHNTLSIGQAAVWFARNTNPPNEKILRVLIFSHFSAERDSMELLKCLARSLFKNGVRPDHVIFTTYDEREDESNKTLKVSGTPLPDFCAMHSSLWKDLDPKSQISIEPTIERAIKRAKQLSAQKDGSQILVTGSLHLVGGAVNLLRPCTLSQS